MSSIYVQQRASAKSCLSTGLGSAVVPVCQAVTCRLGPTRRAYRQLTRPACPVRVYSAQIHMSAVQRIRLFDPSFLAALPCHALPRSYSATQVPLIRSFYSALANPRQSSPQLRGYRKCHTQRFPGQCLVENLLNCHYFCFLPSTLFLEALSCSLLAYIPAVNGFSYCRATR